MSAACTKSRPHASCALGQTAHASLCSDQRIPAQLCSITKATKLAQIRPVSLYTTRKMIELQASNFVLHLKHGFDQLTALLEIFMVI